MFFLRVRDMFHIPADAKIVIFIPRYQRVGEQTAG
jgi:hypothetical protein